MDGEKSLPMVMMLRGENSRVVVEAAKQRLAEMAKGSGVGDKNCHLLEGRPATEVHNLCDKLSIDLVVIGTHGQAGLQLLLGSTANSVLHGSKCDVLAVRLPG